MTALLAAVMIVGALQGGPGFRTLAMDSMSNIDESRQATARTPQEWTALWRAHAGDRPAPRVDFGTSIVAAVFLGSRSTAGYKAEITGITVAGKTMTIEWREGRPDRDSILAQVITSPAHLVAIPKFDGEIVFTKAAP
jgi:hypothetical protein